MINEEPILDTPATSLKMHSRRRLDIRKRQLIDAQQDVASYFSNIKCSQYSFPYIFAVSTGGEQIRLMNASEQLILLVRPDDILPLPPPFEESVSSAPLSERFKLESCYSPLSQVEIRSMLDEALTENISLSYPFHCRPGLRNTRGKYTQGICLLPKLVVSPLIAPCKSYTPIRFPNLDFIPSQLHISILPGDQPPPLLTNLHSIPPTQNGRVEDKPPAYSCETEEMYVSASLLHLMNWCHADKEATQEKNLLQFLNKFSFENLCIIRPFCLAVRYNKIMTLSLNTNQEEDTLKEEKQEIEDILRIFFNDSIPLLTLVFLSIFTSVNTETNGVTDFEKNSTKMVEFEAYLVKLLSLIENSTFLKLHFLSNIIKDSLQTIIDTCQRIKRFMQQKRQNIHTNEKENYYNTILESDLPFLHSSSTFSLRNCILTEPLHSWPSPIFSQFSSLQSFQIENFSSALCARGILNCSLRRLITILHLYSTRLIFNQPKRRSSNLCIHDDYPLPMNPAPIISPSEYALIAQVPFMATNHSLSQEMNSYLTKHSTSLKDCVVTSATPSSSITKSNNNGLKAHLIYLRRTCPMSLRTVLKSPPHFDDHLDYMAFDQSKAVLNGTDQKVDTVQNNNNSHSFSIEKMAAADDNFLKKKTYFSSPLSTSTGVSSRSISRVISQVPAEILNSSSPIMTCKKTRNCHKKNFLSTQHRDEFLPSTLGVSDFTPTSHNVSPFYQQSSYSTKINSQIQSPNHQSNLPLNDFSQNNVYIDHNDELRIDLNFERNGFFQQQYQNEPRTNFLSYRDFLSTQAFSSTNGHVYSDQNACKISNNSYNESKIHVLSKKLAANHELFQQQSHQITQISPDPLQFQQVAGTSYDINRNFNKNGFAWNHSQPYRQQHLEHCQVSEQLTCNDSCNTTETRSSGNELPLPWNAFHNKNTTLHQYHSDQFLISSHPETNVEINYLNNMNNFSDQPTTDSLFSLNYPNTKNFDVFYLNQAATQERPSQFPVGSNINNFNGIDELYNKNNVFDFI